MVVYVKSNSCVVRSGMANTDGDVNSGVSLTSSSVATMVTTVSMAGDPLSSRCTSRLYTACGFSRFAKPPRRMTPVVGSRLNNPFGSPSSMVNVWVSSTSWSNSVTVYTWVPTGVALNGNVFSRKLNVGEDVNTGASLTSVVSREHTTGN